MSWRLSGRARARAAAAVLLGVGCATASSTARSDHRAERWPQPIAARCAWGAWEDYAARFIEESGRVVDLTDGARSTSEGQAYGLALALIAGDRARFDKILRWTDLHLARAELGERLPSWLWSDDEGTGGFRVADPNSASDADLWMAYALLEAGRLFAEPRYAALGSKLVERIREKELVELAGLGVALLPGESGFLLDGGQRTRLNPSYAPLFILRRFSSLGLPGAWDQLAEVWARLLREAGPYGLQPDWVVWDGQRFTADPKHGSVGSYDAIRNILWAAMIDRTDPLADQERLSTAGLARWYAATGKVPERVDASLPPPEDPADERATGLSGHEGPVGFWAALLPALSQQDPAAAEALRSRVTNARGPTGNFVSFGQPPHYYDQNLALLALGFLGGELRFARDGHMEPRWTTCDRP